MTGIKAFAWTRFVIIAFVGLVAAAGWALPAAAQSVTVNVGGQPLYMNPGPIERAGRVFVPLRSIFERMGASVVYQAGLINATKGSSSISLRIGSTQATVNGQPTTIDVAPFIVGATTYVPLRFVAQSLGANVGYNGQTRIVAIDLPHGGPIVPVHPVRPIPPPSSAAHLRGQQPAPGSQVYNRFATIAADFSNRVNASSVRIWLDGNNITGRCALSQTNFSYRPPAPLGFGSHTVRVSGNDLGGSFFDRSWSFSVAGQPLPPPGPIELRSRQPAPGSSISNRFALISAEFTYNVNAGSVRVWLDDNDITSRSGVSSTGFSYKPPAPLEFGSHTVRVSGRDGRGTYFERSWSFSISGAPVPEPTSPIQLSGRQPAPGAQVQNRFATIAANFTMNADSSTVRVRLDGNDITSRAGVSSSGFSYKPPAPLDFGSHTVRVTGRGGAGRQFDHSWSFTVVRGGPAPNPGPVSLTINQPAPNDSVDSTFVVQGTTVGDARVRVTAGAGPNANGQFNETTTAGPKGNFRVKVVLQPLMGQGAVRVQITATDPNSGATGQKTLQLRLNQ